MVARISEDVHWALFNTLFHAKSIEDVFCRLIPPGKGDRLQDLKEVAYPVLEVCSDRRIVHNHGGITRVIYGHSVPQSEERLPLG